MKCAIIVWLDAASGVGWVDAATCGLLPIDSVGCIVQETKEFIALSAARSGNPLRGYKFRDPISIPKKSIKKIVRFDSNDKET